MKYLWAFLVGIFLIGLGVVITFFELSEFTFFNDNNFAKEDFTYEDYELSYNNSCITLNLYNNKNYEIVYDETLDNQIIVSYPYIKDMYNINMYENKYDDCKVYNFDLYFEFRSFTIKPYIDRLIEDIKDKKIYNYANISYEKVIISLPKNIEHELNIVH